MDHDWVPQSSDEAQFFDFPGTVHQPFETRLNRSWTYQCGGILTVAFSIIIIFRCWHLLCASTAAWLLVSLVGGLADIAWRARWRSSYGRWRELPAALLILNSFGPPAAWELMRQLLDEHSLPGSAAGSPGGTFLAHSAHLAHMLFASGAAKMAAMALSLRLRLWLSAAVQLALFVASIPHSPRICAAAPFVHPAGQQMTHDMYQSFHGLAGLVSVPVPSTWQPSAEVECITLLTYFRAAGLLLTLFWATVSDARHFEGHQRQRRRAGLPPERGLHAAVYSAALHLAWGGRALSMALVAWVLCALAWDCSIFLCSRGQEVSGGPSDLSPT